MRTSKDEREFQLQLWNGREYETLATGTHEALEEPFARHTGLHRRIVLTEKARDAVPKKWYRRPSLNRASRTTDQIIADYAAWAKLAQLQQITCYRHTAVPLGRWASVRLVDVKDFLGEGPLAEPDADVSQAA